MIKHIISIACVFIIVISVSGCSSNSESDNANATQDTVATYKVNRGEFDWSGNEYTSVLPNQKEWNVSQYLVDDSRKCCSVIIDNSDITKPCSPKMEAISDVHDGSTGEIRKGYFTVETAVLSQNEKMQNIMDVAGNYKGNYRMDFKDKHGKKIECKISYIPVQLCEFPNKTLVLVAVYGFGAQPMLLLTNLDLSEKKKLCMIATKVYLMRWRIEEYFKFKKQQFELEDLRVMSLQSIRNLNLFATLVTGYIGIMSCEKDDTIFMLELKECSKRIFDVPKFIFYGLGYAIERVLARTHSGIKGFLLKKEQSQQLTLAECFAGLGFK